MITSSDSNGTGFFIADPSRVLPSNNDWYVLTNAHVVGDDDYVWVSWYSDTPEIFAKVLGKDELADVALLDTRPNDFMSDGIGYLRRWSPDIYADDDVQFGDDVIAAGFPGGLSGSNEFSITRGSYHLPASLLMGYSM